MVAEARSYRYEAGSEADTDRLASHLAAGMVPGYMVALDGDLGAGKTRFTQAVARALGVKQLVNSPTFTIVKEYEDGRLPLYHMDVYRISQEEAEELGLEEYLYGPGVTVMEWASLVPELLPLERMGIYIEVRGATERSFRLTAHGDAYDRWCRKLAELGVLSVE